MMNNNALILICCFCKKNIESNKTDPCGINFVINIDKSQNKQLGKKFFCHLICFKNELAPSTLIFVESALK